MHRFLEGVRRWLQAMPESNRREVVFGYAGSDSETVKEACRVVGLGSQCRTDIRGYLPLRKLAALCSTSTVNCYLWLPTTFHHKLLELLACGRPVLAFPGEHPEARFLAKTLEGELFVCKDGMTLTSGLKMLAERNMAASYLPTTRAGLSMTWWEQTQLLKQVLCG